MVHAGSRHCHVGASLWENRAADAAATGRLVEGHGTTRSSIGRHPGLRPCRCHARWQNPCLYQGTHSGSPCRSLNPSRSHRRSQCPRQSRCLCCRRGARHTTARLAQLLSRMPVVRLYRAHPQHIVAFEKASLVLGSDLVRAVRTRNYTMRCVMVTHLLAASWGRRPSAGRSARIGRCCRRCRRSRCQTRCLCRSR